MKRFILKISHFLIFSDINFFFLLITIKHVIFLENRKLFLKKCQKKITHLVSLLFGNNNIAYLTSKTIDKKRYFYLLPKVKEGTLREITTPLTKRGGKIGVRFS